MEPKSQCDNCRRIWNDSDLGEIQDFWGRVEPGNPMPSGQCPDPDCRALCYPMSEATAVVVGRERLAEL